MKKLFLAALSLSIISFSSCDSNRTTTSDDSVERAEDINEERLDDRSEDIAEFMVAAANSNMAEVNLGKLAAERATDPEVKRFGEMMANDHGKANEELRQLAQRKNVTLPETVGSDKKEKYNDLSEKSGNDFDKEYIDMMVDAHEKDVKRFKEASEDLEDPEVRAYASKNLPTLQSHLDQVKKIDERLDKK